MSPERFLAAAQQARVAVWPRRAISRDMVAPDGTVADAWARNEIVAAIQALVEATTAPEGTLGAKS